MDDGDSNRSKQGGDDDSYHDGGSTKACPDVIVDRTRNVDRLAENLVGEDTEYEGHDPDDTKDTLVINSWSMTDVWSWRCFMTLPEEYMDYNTLSFISLHTYSDSWTSPVKLTEFDPC